MATITTVPGAGGPAAGRPLINANFAAINTELIATTAAVAGKASASTLATHVADTANPHGVTKAQVGLGNADNTSNATGMTASAGGGCRPDERS